MKANYYFPFLYYNHHKLFDVFFRPFRNEKRIGWERRRVRLEAGGGGGGGGGGRGGMMYIRTVKLWTTFESSSGTNRFTISTHENVVLKLTFELIWYCSICYHDWLYLYNQNFLSFIHIIHLSRSDCGLQTLMHSISSLSFLRLSWSEFKYGCVHWHDCISGAGELLSTCCGSCCLLSVHCLLPSVCCTGKLFKRKVRILFIKIISSCFIYNYEHFIQRNKWFWQVSVN